MKAIRLRPPAAARVNRASCLTHTHWCSEKSKRIERESNPRPPGLPLLHHLSLLSYRCAQELRRPGAARSEVSLSLSLTHLRSVGLLEIVRRGDIAILITLTGKYLPSYLISATKPSSGTRVAVRGNIGKCGKSRPALYHFRLHHIRHDGDQQATGTHP